MLIYERLKSLGISLPQPIPPVASFAHFVRSGGLIFLSGHIAKKDGKPWIGTLGGDVTTEQGEEAARGVAIDLLGTLHMALGDLDKVRRMVKLTVLVNSTPSFTDQHLVANGGSDLLSEVLGERGCHARCAYGVAQIPFGSCVEIDLIAEVSD